MAETGFDRAAESLRQIRDRMGRDLERLSEQAHAVANREYGTDAAALRRKLRDHQSLMTDASAVILAMATFRMRLQTANLPPGVFQAAKISRQDILNDILSNIQYVKSFLYPMSAVLRGLHLDWEQAEKDEERKSGLRSALDPDDEEDA